MKVGGIIRKVYPTSTLISIKRFKKGLINETYDVRIRNPNNSLVVRIYPKDLWKVKKESYLYDLINKKVPIPKILFKGRNYLVMSRVGGKELKVNKKTIKEAGSLLAKIHSIKFPYYGWIIGNKIKPGFSEWSKFVIYDFNKKVNSLLRSGLINKKTKNKIKKIIHKDKSLLNIKSKPCLLHKDYHSSHILVKGNKIKGIIDFEWAIAGHNELDITKSSYYMFEGRPKLEKVFLQGYNRYGKISKEFNERKRLYKLLTILSSLSFSNECQNKKWCRFNYKKLMGELNEYNQGYGKIY